MTLEPGTQLGVYEVLAPIGKGGMGEVYRARDTKLGREVAIKVLPDEFSNDRERLSRFEREAKLLAALNHASIATLHGLEESEGVHFLVMELVEGETLAERIAGGPLPLAETLSLFEQIAEGLEAAHSKHIIHRDFKPANTKITPEGKIKILDFGLAKLIREKTRARDPSEFSTFAENTSAITLLGTVPYMSPEQVRSKPLDPRTDIWSFGCVLYEALTGKMAFTGPTVSDTLGAILNQEPDWSALNDDVPVRIRELIERCLRKDPNRRLQHIGDARLSLLETREGWESAATPVRGRRKSRLPWVAAIVATVVLSLLGARELERFREAPAGPILRTELTLPGSTGAGIRGIAPLALSPDGRYLVYSAGSSDSTFTHGLHAMQLEKGETVLVPGGEGGMAPFFSPDGSWLGFFAQGHVRKVKLPDGVPVDICDVPPAMPGHLSARWFADDIYFSAPSPRSGIWRVPSSGGEPLALVSPDKSQEEVFYAWPEVLPDGRSLLFTIGKGEQEFDTVLYQLDTGEQRLLIEDASHARYAPTGRILFQRSGRLLAVPFDPRARRLKGTPVVVLDDVASYAIFGGASISTFSQDGTMVYANMPERSGSLVWLDRDGAEEVITDLRRDIRYPKLSPDGKAVALVIHEQPPEHHADLWRYDLSRATLERLTFGQHTGWFFWEPDGKGIIVTTNVPSFGYDRLRVLRVAADGRGEPELLIDEDYSGFAWSSTPDGGTLYLVQGDVGRGTSRICTFSRGLRELEPFLENDFILDEPTPSPDGRWLAFDSTESGRYEIYLMPLSGSGARIQISDGGGYGATWNPNGEELFYIEGNHVMAVDIEADPELSVGRPEVLFELDAAYVSPLDNYVDVDSTGTRFLTVRQGNAESRDRVHVITNWFEELKRLVPSED